MLYSTLLVLVVDGKSETTETLKKDIHVHVVDCRRRLSGNMHVQCTRTTTTTKQILQFGTVILD